MAMFNGSGLTAAQVTSKVQNRLYALRQAYDATEELFAWSSGVSVNDLVGIGFASTDAQELLGAIADAHGEFELRTTGSDPRNPGPGYVYAASQNAVIGPQ